MRNSQGGAGPASKKNDADRVRTTEIIGAVIHAQSASRAVAGETAAPARRCASVRRGTEVRLYRGRALLVLISGSVSAV